MNTEIAICLLFGSVPRHLPGGSDTTAPDPETVNAVLHQSVPGDRSPVSGHVRDQYPCHRQRKCHSVTLLHCHNTVLESAVTLSLCYSYASDNVYYTIPVVEGGLISGLVIHQYT